MGSDFLLEDFRWYSCLALIQGTLPAHPKAMPPNSPAPRFPQAFPQGPLSPIGRTLELRDFPFWGPSW